jgi:hypothetical protein
MPKHLGGLAILNLRKFARALHLSWLWYEWQPEDKPWKDMDMAILSTTKDRTLFEKATKITLGNGHNAIFWTAAWLQGQASKGIAPSLRVFSFFFRA